MYKISIIIPVYNAEKYISRCISSIINQSMDFKDIEVIFVDDNSNDNSRVIIEDYTKKYDNVQAIFLKNNHGSPSIPRNKGIENATAEYIMFMDNDDEYDSKICEILFQNITSNNVDFVSCRYVRVKSNGEVFIEKPLNYYDEDIVLLTGEDILKFEDWVVWNKIFKKEIILKNNISFPDSRCEDYYFSYKYFIFSSAGLYLQKYFGYKWYVIDDSLSRTLTYEEYKGILSMYVELCLELKNNNINPRLFFNNNIYGELLFHMFDKGILDGQNHDGYELFEIYCMLEKELGYPSYCPKLTYKIGKNLILKKYFSLSRVYFKLVSYIYNVNFINKIYNFLRYGNN